MASKLVCDEAYVRMLGLCGSDGSRVLALGAVAVLVVEELASSVRVGANRSFGRRRQH